MSRTSLLSGDAILLKRALVERIGVLDLRFFGYFGDLDYGMRAAARGVQNGLRQGRLALSRGRGSPESARCRQSRCNTPSFHAKRMALVDAAYQEFRAKWHLDGPETWQVHQSTDFVAKAKANADRVALKYDFPASANDDLEFF